MADEKKKSTVTNASDALSSIFDQIDSDNPNKYPSGRTVADLHRNADVDKSERAFHHTLGTGRYSASPGDHRHDGEGSIALYDGIEFVGNVASAVDRASFIRKMVEALSRTGATDVTTDTPVGITWQQLKDGF